MQQFRVIVLFLLSAFHLCQAAEEDFQPTESYERKDFLDKGKNVKLFWKFNATHITFELHVKTQGWVGLGLNTAPGMRNADIVVGWVTSDGTAYLTDRIGPAYGNGFPPLDASQDVELLEGRECGGVTMIKFRRKLKACDSKDLSIGEDTLRILYAFGTADPLDDNTLSWADMHTTSNRGSKSAVLLSGSVAPPDYSDEESKTFDLLNDGYEIPVQSTYYNCRLLKLPELTTKHHVTQFEPVIEENYVANVHHLLINVCNRMPNESLVGRNGECYGGDLQGLSRDCNYVVGGWAVGGGSFYFPKEVGLALGEPNSPKYVLLETHYDNPNLVEIRDHSGFRVHYTSHLRRYDSGELTVGHITHGYALTIPPGQKSMEIYGQCDPDCLAAGMEAAGVDNITVFATFPHTHLAGKSIRVQHIRNGTELPYLVKDDSYDFDYQEARSVPEWRVIKKGDTLLTRCVYDSSTRTKMTYGGLATNDEMCLTFLYYYPRIPIGNCISAPSVNTDVLDSMLGIMGTRWEKKTPSWSLGSLEDLTITKPDYMANMTMGQACDQFPWTEQAVAGYTQAIYSQWQWQYCSSLGNIPLSRYRLSPMVTINEPYVESKINCSALSSGQLVTETAAAECAAPNIN